MKASGGEPGPGLTAARREPGACLCCGGESYLQLFCRSALNTASSNRCFHQWTCGWRTAAGTLVMWQVNFRTGSEMEVPVSVNKRNDH